MIRKTALALLLLSSLASLTANAEEAAPKADPAKAQAIVNGVCVACHGADGNSPVPTNPSLAGQGAEYIAKQLSNFQSVGGKPALRQNPIMNGMAAALSDDDKRNLGAYFAGQKLRPSIVKDEKQIALGQKLWRAGDLAKGIPACAGCHGPTGSGLPAKYPRLSGQYAEYTEAQLKAFRAGDRANDPEAAMRTIAAKMSDPEIKAVAEYAAGLR
jgi:cytochrome c553